MNAFLRQMAVLGILTALAEHLLPEGGLQKAGRLVMGLLMMLTILTAILNLLKMPLPDIAGLFRFQQQAELTALTEPQSYRDTVLESLRRQVQDSAERAAQSAGYPHTAAQAELSQNGEILWIRLSVQADDVPAFQGETAARQEYQMLIAGVAAALSLKEDRIFLESGGTVR